jgi:hypothetical protein
MATDSILGLFTDPTQYLLQQNQAQDASAMRFAQLNPMQQAQYGIYKGAAQLGGGIGSALGAQDPVLQMQTQRQQILRTIDQTDPSSIAAAAQQLSRIGDQQGAVQLAELSRTAALKKAQADKAMRTASSTTVSERNREMIANAEIKLAQGQDLTPEEEARVRWLIGQENKPKIFRDSDTGEITTIEPIDLATSAPNLAKLVGKGAKEGGSTGGGATGVTGTVITTPATKLPASIKKEVGNVDEQMTVLDSSINKLTALTPKINNLDLGLYQNIERGVSGFLGKPTKDTVEFKQLRRAVLEQANNLLLLAKGTQTEGDAQRARDQIADEDTWKNKELLTSAFEDLKKTLENTQEALKAKRTTLTSPGIPAVPGLTAADVAPKPSPFSNVNPQLQPTPEKPPAPQGKPLTQDIINKANDAIKRGAPREAVLKRLKDQGYIVQ